MLYGRGAGDNTNIKEKEKKYDTRKTKSRAST